MSLGGYVTRDLHRRIIYLARREGMAEDKFGFFKKLILEALENRRTSARSSRLRNRSRRSVRGKER